MHACRTDTVAEMMPRIALALGAVVLVAACGSSTSSTPTTTTVPGPTVQQVASVVAQQRATVQSVFDKDIDCKGIDLETCPTAQSAYDRASDADTQLGTVIASLTAIKHPPAEVSALLAQTVATVLTAGNAAGKFVGCFNDNAGGDRSACSTQEQAWDDAGNKLSTVFDGWKPYGV